MTRTRRNIALLALLSLLQGCAQSSIEFNPSTGLLRITDPKDTKLSDLEVTRDNAGGFTLKLHGLDANASNPASVQVQGAEAVARGVAEGMVKGAKPIP